MVVMGLQRGGCGDGGAAVAIKAKCGGGSVWWGGGGGLRRI